MTALGSYTMALAPLQLTSKDDEGTTLGPAWIFLRILQHKSVLPLEIVFSKDLTVKFWMKKEEDDNSLQFWGLCGNLWNSIDQHLKRGNPHLLLGFLFGSLYCLGGIVLQCRITLLHCPIICQPIWAFWFHKHLLLPLFYYLSHPEMSKN